MTFYPIEFVGVELFRIPGQFWGLFGVQGIIPTKAFKMASICFDLMTTKLLNIKEIFGRLDPAQFSHVMEDGLLLIMDDILNQVSLEYMPAVWTNLPDTVKKDFVILAESDAVDFVAAFMADLKLYLDDVIDLKTMCVTECVRRKEL